MIRELLKKKRLYFDGGTGTLLQEMGLKGGEPPELWNKTNPQKITDLHKAYLDAGSDIISTNTFGINKLKYENYGELIAAGIDCAKKAVGGRQEKFVAFDMGPTGKLLEPLGELSFEDAVELFAANVKVAAKCGADLIIIETMNDSYESKAAVLAAKENCDLPVFVTNVYDESRHLMTGADPKAMVAMLEGLRVDALGVNCSLGPDKMLPVVKELCEYASVPIIVNPNAGLPEAKNGVTVYNVNADDFSDSMRQIAICGASVLGGCCGTTPEFIRKTVEKTRNLPLPEPKNHTETLISSYTHAVEIGKDPVLIGERINPTGKPKFKDALRRGDINYILSEGLNQADKGVHILDVNVGLPEIDEKAMMLSVVKQLQALCNLPLQIDTTDKAVLESALRAYNGKALINSVNGDQESMSGVFPLVKKYGGAVIALTLDKNGIPNTAEERFNIALKIIETAEKYGIQKRDIIVDPLALTVSSNQESAKITLKTIKLLKDAGIKTSLGVSNISFGLPRRELINSAFFTAALTSGLDCAIMNPFSADMMNSYFAYRALAGIDPACADYIAYASEAPSVEAAKPQTDPADLKTAVIKGVKETAVKATEILSVTTAPLEIIDNFIIPALDEIGAAFENKKAYLPQLLMSAEAASAAFEVIKRKIPDKAGENGKKFVIATVKGDIHDIGKNIVKVMLQSYGFNVIDLGRDVDPEIVVETALQENCKLVGLSALMTTTVPSMEQTIALLHKADPDIKVVVGGAVLTQEYADMIKADCYAKDAMETVRYAEKFYS
ncbi:MAG: homocysteine S-methyltransferase family protein [Acutalibacteraceae bacterium]